MQRLFGKTKVMHDKALLGVVADEQCVSILQSLDTEKSVSQLSIQCGINAGTVYRKLKILQKSGLLETSCEIRPDGKKFFLYRSLVKDFVILFIDNKLEISVVLGRDEPS